MTTLAVCSLIWAAACNKDDDNITLTAKEQLLIQRAWKITALTQARQSDPSQDSSILKNCTNDDLLVFGVWGNTRIYQLADSASRCDTSLLAYDYGNWSMNTAEDKLQFTGTRRGQTWTILVLNDSILTVQWRDSTSVSHNILKTISLKNK